MSFRLTGRDEILLNFLAEHYLLSTAQIKKLVFKKSSKGVILRRLRKLEKAKMIQRAARDETTQWVWILGETSRARFAMSKKLKINKNSLSHDLASSDVRIKLEDLRFATHFRSAFKTREKISERISPQNRALDQIPDWICLINFKSSKKVSALEIELNYKGKKRMEKVLKTYCYKKEIERIIYFVPNLAMGKKMLTLAKNYEFERGKTWFLFLTLTDFFKFGEDAWVYYLGGKKRLKEICRAHSSVNRVGKQFEKKEA